MTTLAELGAAHADPAHPSPAHFSPSHPDPVLVSRSDRHTLVELRAVGGVDAGRVWALGMGTHSLGSAPEGTVVLRGSADPLHTARLTVTADSSVWLAFPSPSADGGPEPTPEGPILRQLRPLGTEFLRCAGQQFRWPEGAELSIGGSVLSLVRPGPFRSPQPETAMARVEQTLLLERAARCAEVADPAAVALDALGSGASLWRLRPGDVGRLRLRVGSAEGISRAEASANDLPADVAERLAGHWILPGLSCGVDLAECGVLGVCGDLGVARALARWLVVQAATRCAPAGLSIRVFADPYTGGDWDWVGRLPHLAAQRGREGLGAAAAYVASEPRRVGRAITELAAEVEARSAGEHASSRPDILTVFDRASLLRRVEGVADILSKGPACGVYAICLDAEEQLVPECRTVVHSSVTSLALTSPGQSAGQPSGITPDLVAREWCARMADALSAHDSAG
jgi:hypothetical protein